MQHLNLDGLGGTGYLNYSTHNVGFMGEFGISTWGILGVIYCSQCWIYGCFGLYNPRFFRFNLVFRRICCCFDVIFSFYYHLWMYLLLQYILLGQFLFIEFWVFGKIYCKLSKCINQYKHLTYTVWNTFHRHSNSFCIYPLFRYSIFELNLGWSRNCQSGCSGMFICLYTRGTNTIVM